MIGFGSVYVFSGGSSLTNIINVFSVLFNHVESSNLRVGFLASLCGNFSVAYYASREYGDWVIWHF